MARSYSQDLRERIVGSIHSGNSRRAAAARFGVSPSTAVRLQACFESTGSVATARQGRPPGGGKLGPHRDFLIEQVELKPDITMPELLQTCWICCKLNARCSSAGLSAV